MDSGCQWLHFDDGGGFLEESVVLHADDVLLIKPITTTLHGRSMQEPRHPPVFGLYFPDGSLVSPSIITAMVSNSLKDAAMDLLDTNKRQQCVLIGLESLYEPVVQDEPSAFAIVTEEFFSPYDQLTMGPVEQAC